MIAFYDEHRVPLLFAAVVGPFARCRYTETPFLPDAVCNLSSPTYLRQARLLFNARYLVPCSLCGYNTQVWPREESQLPRCERARVSITLVMSHSGRNLYANSLRHVSRTRVLARLEYKIWVILASLWYRRNESWDSKYFGRSLPRSL